MNTENGNMTKKIIKTLYYPIAITIACFLLCVYIAAGVISVITDILSMIARMFTQTTEKVLNQLEMWGDRL